MAFKNFLDLKVGDKVVCLDEYSGEHLTMN